MTKIEAVLFDLDGTLLDSAYDLTNAINKMLVQEGRNPLSFDEVRPMLGTGAMELCRLALEKTGGCDSDDLFPYVQKYVGFYRQIEPDSNQVYPDARAFLDELQTKGVKMGVCTNKPHEATHGVLAALGLDHYFGFIAGGDTFEVHKPNPAHVTNVLEKLGVPMDKTLFVGAGRADVVACQRAEIPCIIMTQGYGEDFDELKPDAFASNFDELRAVIKKLDLEF